MAFTYAAFLANEADLTVPGYPLTNHNMLPALVLWSAITLNLCGRYPNSFSNITEADINLLAQALGVTTSTVTQFLAIGEQDRYRPALMAAAKVFESVIANPPIGPHYGDVGCPNKLDPIISLATAGAMVSDPGKDTSPVARPHKVHQAAK